MSLKPKTKTISERFYNTDQSWVYERVIRDQSGEKLRCLIRRNAYNDQSYLRGYQYKGGRWNLLVDRPIEGANCFSVRYHVNQNPDQYLFESDANDVFAELLDIVL